MYKYTPPKKNIAAVVMSALLFLCAGVALCFSVYGLGLIWLFRMISAAVLMLGIQITTRYILTSFTYSLSDLFLLHESNDFIVERSIRGKREIVCRLSLYGASAELIPKAGAKPALKEYGKISRKFNFCSNIFAQDVWYILFEMNSEKCLISIEANAEFVRQFEIRQNPIPPMSEQ